MNIYYNLEAKKYLNVYQNISIANLTSMPQFALLAHKNKNKDEENIHPWKIRHFSLVSSRSFNLALAGFTTQLLQRVSWPFGGGGGGG